MNYNPYAAPQAGPGPVMPPPQGPQGTKQPWDIGEILSLSWDAFKRCWGVVLGAMFVAGIIIYAVLFAVLIPLMQIPDVAEAFRDPASNIGLRLGVQLLAEIVMFIPAAFLSTGMIRIMLSAGRGGTPSFGDLFGGGSRFLPMYGAILLTGLVHVIAMMFLFIPFIFTMIFFIFVPFFVADADLGPIDAMKASYAASKDNWGKLFLLGIVAFLLTLAGELACCVGLLVAVPVTYLALTAVYVRLSGRGTTAGGFDPNGGGYPPGGGYGGPPPGGGYGGPPGGGGGYGGPPGGG
ncbi:MAG: hypothetical protein ABI551_19560, partial [Polyangiaceae bacterium]